MSSKNLIDLFKWNTKVDITNKQGEILETLYVRLVGDVDYNEAQQSGLIASRKLRKRLQDETALDHQSLFLDLDEKESDELIFGILMAEMSTFRDLAVDELGVDVLKLKELSDNPTLEEREQQQEAQEIAEQEKIDKLKDKMSEKSEERKAELKEKSVEELREIFVTSSINIKCLEEFGNVFRDYCVFTGTFINNKFIEKAFNNFDEFRNISPTLKRQLVDAYLSLELTGDQLKN